jgi:hypothetical protein
LLTFCTAGQNVVCAGHLQGASEIVQPLDARISQQEEVNHVTRTSCMLIFRRYNYLLHILINVSHLVGILTGLSKVVQESLEDGQEELIYAINSWK